MGHPKPLISLMCPSPLRAATSPCKILIFIYFLTFLSNSFGKLDTFASLANPLSASFERFAFLVYTSACFVSLCAR